jgi:predicted acylesterase/phospholipase RssA
MSSEASAEWIEQLEPPVALVMGGGASLGASQVGMARALIDRGFEPDMLVGTSVGALNGSFLARAFDHEQVDRLEAIWRGLTREDVFPGVNLVRVIRVLPGESSISPANRESGGWSTNTCRRPTPNWRSRRRWSPATC